MKYAGREWAYRYRDFHETCPEGDLEIQVNRISELYSRLTKAWSIQMNSEWACRTYYSTKMILNATVLWNSRDYAIDVGLRTAVPYYEYYAALSLMRGLVYTLPSETWANGRLLEISHAKSINITFDWIARFSKTKAETLKNKVLQLKAQRELIAYRAPASGDFNLGSDGEFNKLLVLLAEAAQFNSELLQASVEKNADPETFVVLDRDTDLISRVSIEGFKFEDAEDRNRLSYVQRKLKRPFNLALFMTAGQSEDFMGAWDGDEEKEDQFSNKSPSNWRAIFDVP